MKKKKTIPGNTSRFRETIEQHIHVQTGLILVAALLTILLSVCEENIKISHDAHGYALC